MTVTPKKKGFKEGFARFLESPTREGLRDVLKENLGEFRDCDFKAQWLAHPKTARHLLGMANSGGGCIVVGVLEMEDKTLQPAGLDALIDKASVVAGIRKYIPDNLLEDIEILDFGYEDSEYPKIKGRKFQVVFVGDDPEHLPFISRADGEDIRESVIYVRKGTATVEAGYEDLQRVINRRLDTGHSSQREMELQAHLDQLKVLYTQLERYHVRLKPGTLGEYFMRASRAVQEIVGQQEYVPNPKYPKEDFEEFITRVIQKKKKRIETELDVSGY